MDMQICTNGILAFTLYFYSSYWTDVEVEKIFIAGSSCSVDFPQQFSRKLRTKPTSMSFYAYDSHIL